MKIKTCLTILALLVLFFGGVITTRTFADSEDDAGELTGVIQSLPSGSLVGDWRVADHTIHVTSATRINQEHGQAAVGARVEVKGTAQSDGSITASTIEVKSSSSGDGGGMGGGGTGGGGGGMGGGSHDAGEVTGLIQSLPSGGLVGDWQVGGRTIHVTSATRIDQEHGQATVGARVEVKGTAQSDGSITASTVEVKSSGSGDGSGMGGGSGSGGGMGGGSHDAGELTGVVQSLPSGGLVGDWQVADHTIHVTSATRIDQEHGQATVGARVEVKGTAQSDGSITASTVEVKGSSGGGSGDPMPMEFKGTIEGFPSGFVGDWQVGGRTIHVTATTRIEQELGPVAVGAFVEIKGTMQTDGSMTATSIEVKSNVAGGDGRDELKGTIESLPGGGLIGDWRVGGHTVHVTATTAINTEHGAAVVGASVDIHGTAHPDGSIDAARIEVQPSTGGGMGGGSHDAGEVTGLIQSLPSGGLVGDWQVGGRTIHVTSATRIDQEHGQATVGARVEVKGTAQSDGSITASTVEVKSSSSGGDSGSSSTGEAVSFKGAIESLPSGLMGDWTISGRTVHVTSLSQLRSEHGSFAVGVRIKGKGVARTDGSVDASKIQVRE